MNTPNPNFFVLWIPHKRIVSLSKSYKKLPALVTSLSLKFLYAPIYTKLNLLFFPVNLSYIYLFIRPAKELRRREMFSSPIKSTCGFDWIFSNMAAKKNSFNSNRRRDSAYNPRGENIQISEQWFEFTFQIHCTEANVFRLWYEELSLLCPYPSKGKEKYWVLVIKVKWFLRKNEQSNQENPIKVHGAESHILEKR